MQQRRNARILRVMLASLALTLAAGAVGIGSAAAAGSTTLHQYGGCPYGYYSSGGSCLPNNGPYTNQFGCPAGTFYNGAQCTPTRYDSYPGNCPEGYYFDGYACTFAGADRPGPPAVPTPLPGPVAPQVYAPPYHGDLVYGPPPPRVRGVGVRQTIPFTGTNTDRLLTVGVALVLCGLLLLAARELRHRAA